jgi:hypothetical protein
VILKFNRNAFSDPHWRKAKWKITEVITPSAPKRIADLSVEGVLFNESTDLFLVCTPTNVTLVSKTHKSCILTCLKQFIWDLLGTVRMHHYQGKA